MKPSDKTTLLQKSPAELSKVLSDLQKQLAENQAKLASGSLKDTSLFKKLKYQISLIKTHLSSTHVSPS